MHEERHDTGGNRNRTSLQRCSWATSAALIRYHDEEWGVPLHGDSSLFELLVLEGAQAGLSWETVLRKRDRYRELFFAFDPAKVARITAAGVGRILKDPGIVRNRAKVESAIGNARALLAVREEFGSFDAFVWNFVGNAPVLNRPRTPADLPAQTRQSQAMSEQLRRRGFRFVGPTICYAFMQAAGLVNDHLVRCAWRDGPPRAEGP